MVGIGVSLTGMVPASALLARWYRVRLSRMIGVAFSAVGLGVVTFVPLTQYLADQYHWRTAYKALGGMLLAALPLLVLLVPWRKFTAGHPTIAAAAAAARAEGGGWTLASAMRTPIYWGMAQAFFFTATGMFAIIVQLVAFLIDAGFSPIAAATAYGITGMLSAFSVMGSGFVAERFGVRQTVTASFAGTATGMVLLMFLASQPSALLLGAFVVVFGLCMGVRGPIISSVCTRQFAGPRVATIYGTIYACNALGAAFGSLLGGLLLDASGSYRVVLGFSLCAIALALMPFWAVRALRDFR
jgi:predicted MFS family arabinose efflux permease